MLRFFCLASCLFIFSSGASAATAGSGPNPYSDCGIGAALFPNTSWAAAISNVIWDVGTTAVISATASPQTCEGENVVAAIFIRDTYDQLIEDTATGQGAHATALFEIFSCSATEQKSAIAAFRPEVQKVISRNDYLGQPTLERAAAIYQAAQGTAANHCATS